MAFFEQVCRALIRGYSPLSHPGARKLGASHPALAEDYSWGHWLPSTSGLAGTQANRKFSDGELQVLGVKPNNIQLWGPLGLSGTSMMDIVTLLDTPLPNL